MVNYFSNKGPQSLGMGTSWGLGYNSITVRGSDILDQLPSTKRSKNMAEVHLKTLRLFRKVCRLMPFILRVHQITQRVNPTQATLNVAEHFRAKSHVRDLAIADRLLFLGYEKLYEAEQHYTYSTFLYQWVCPPNYTPNDRGFSYLEEKKLAGKTRFLKEFYKGKGPHYQNP
eukprot:TRINITY_DN1139_c0_g1_i5.p1 TRINITY_DN1139_c0_g1~~TRINITY_DN1139_c0_g1_i5.p1  ORF type:complete len:172 (+),score=42.61 TRINITY_DN1139_c0_g1_i5:209-724(+)